MSVISLIILCVAYGIAIATAGLTQIAWQFWIGLVCICCAYLCGVTTD